jgi:predicted transcriptional regulator YdeE
MITSTELGFLNQIWEPADGPDFEKYDERFKFGTEDSELDLYVPVEESDACTQN